MNRRSFLLTLPCAALARPAFAATQPPNQPWMANVLNGGLVNGEWQLGLEVLLQPKWKTYWRVPGDGGVPPDIQVKGPNVKSFRFDCPTPLRILTPAGEAIGYEATVVFPIAVTAADPGQPLVAEISAFLGVCLEICIPAQMKLQVGAASPGDASRLAKWRALVPDSTVPFVTRATAVASNGEPAVHMELARPVEDVFAEGKPLHYFKAPVFDGTTATLPVAGAGSVDELRGEALRVTGRLAQGGLEQMIMVA